MGASIQPTLKPEESELAGDLFLDSKARGGDRQLAIDQRVDPGREVRLGGCGNVSEVAFGDVVELCLGIALWADGWRGLSLCDLRVVGPKILQNLELVVAGGAVVGGVEGDELSL